jgi:hypothetical protein
VEWRVSELEMFEVDCRRPFSKADFRSIVTCTCKRKDFLKGKSKMIQTATSYLFAMFILVEMLAAASTALDAPDKTIAAKRTSSVVIVLTNDTGMLTSGENHFCVLFQSRSPTPAEVIREVSIDFKLLVGRIQEAPITVHLNQNGADQYCGHINLGSQYYHPANYYALVRYVEATGKKKSSRLFLTVK